MLKKLIEEAYQTFAIYKAERPLDVCTYECCMRLEDEGRLATLDVRQIPVELLMEYNDSAKPKKTRITEVKHFLPRYLELIAEFDFPTNSTELSLSRLTPFDKNEWTSAELELLETFFTTFFKHCLQIYPIPPFDDRIETILIMLWRADFSLDKYLNVWEQTDCLESILHFKDLYFHGFDGYNRAKLANAFADKAISERLKNWVESKQTKVIFKQRIENVIWHFNLDETTVNELNLLYEIIETKNE